MRTFMFPKSEVILEVRQCVSVSVGTIDIEYYYYYYHYYDIILFLWLVHSWCYSNT